MKGLVYETSVLDPEEVGTEVPYQFIADVIPEYVSADKGEDITQCHNRLMCFKTGITVVQE